MAGALHPPGQALPFRSSALTLPQDKIRKDLCIMAYRGSNRPPGGTPGSALGLRPFGPETVPRTVSETGLTPWRAL